MRAPGRPRETTTFRVLHRLAQTFNANRGATMRGLAVAVAALSLTALPVSASTELGTITAGADTSTAAVDVSTAVQGLLAVPPPAATSVRLPPPPRADRAARPAVVKPAAAKPAAKPAAKTTVKKTTSTTVAPPAGRSVEAVVGFALAQVGKPYVWGAAGPGSYDCSGLVMASFARAGIRLPHQSEQIRAYGRSVSREQLQRGDVILYNGHVAIALGGNMMVHAANPRTGIVVAKIYGSPVGYRRML